MLTSSLWSEGNGIEKVEDSLRSRSNPQAIVPSFSFYEVIYFKMLCVVKMC